MPKNIYSKEMESHTINITGNSVLFQDENKKVCFNFHCLTFYKKVNYICPFNDIHTN